jgi:hypothetical protein
VKDTARRLRRTDKGVRKKDRYTGISDRYGRGKYDR